MGTGCGEESAGWIGRRRRGWEIGRLAREGATAWGTGGEQFRRFWSSGTLPANEMVTRGEMMYGRPRTRNWDRLDTHWDWSIISSISSRRSQRCPPAWAASEEAIIPSRREVAAAKAHSGERRQAVLPTIRGSAHHALFALPLQTTDQTPNDRFLSGLASAPFAGWTVVLRIVNVACNILKGTSQICWASGGYGITDEIRVARLIFPAEALCHPCGSFDPVGDGGGDAVGCRSLVLPVRVT